MKNEKLSLKGIKNVLSRTELKKIMAGSGCCNCCYCYDVGGGGGFTTPGTDCMSICGDLIAQQGNCY